MDAMLSIREQEIVRDISIGASVFSFVGCIFIIACYTKFRDLRSFAFELVLCLSISDLISSFVKLWGDAGNHGKVLCWLQAFLMAFGELASVLWAAALAFVLHMAFLRGDPAFGPSSIVQYRKKFHGAVWGTTLGLSLLPSFTGSYGDIGEWCWILSTRSIDTAWRFMQFYIIMWVAVGYCIFVYFSVRKKMKESAGSELATRIMYYPLVLAIIWLPGSIGVFWKMVGGSNHLSNKILVAFCSGIFGFANAVVYGLTPVVRTRVKEVLGLASGGEDNGLLEPGTGSEAHSDLEDGSQYL